MLWSSPNRLGGHLKDLRKVLEWTRKFGLKMNPKKCAFGVSAGQFLGFLVHERGIEIGLKSQEAVKAMKPPTEAHRQNQLCQMIYLQSVWAYRAVHGSGEDQV